MCEREFQKNRLNFAVEVKSDRMSEVTEHFGFKTVDDLIASVGYGKITPLQIVRKIIPKSESEPLQESILNKFIGRVKKKKPHAGVVVKGVDDMLLKFGKCCQPVPGDPITGYITRGYGITVHRTNCVNALKLNPERQIEVEWSTEIKETYPVKIRVRSYDRVGLLADIAEGISKNGANILSASTETNAIQDVDSIFTISVENTEHLRKVLSSIKKVKHVQEVKRIA
jgi:GTP pyrophosphokinase